MGNGQEKKRLPAWMKMLYGSGDWGISTGGMMRLIFYAIYMTDLVGLDPS
jgi:Na+/melibiose symporter-like transporter